MIKTSFGIDRGPFILESRYFNLSIILSDVKKKKDEIFYIKLINNWIESLKATSTRFGEMWVSVNNIEHIKTQRSELPFRIVKTLQVRLELRRPRNDLDLYEALIRRWKEKILSINITKRGAVINLIDISDA
jgi:hypothetical protein